MASQGDPVKHFKITSIVSNHSKKIEKGGNTFKYILFVFHTDISTRKRQKENKVEKKL